MADTEKTVRLRKRRHSSKSTAEVTITVTRKEMVTKTRREWRQLRDEGDKYGYVDDVWPQAQVTELLAQSLPADKFDLAKVIKAINSI